MEVIDPPYINLAENPFSKINYGLITLIKCQKSFMQVYLLNSMKYVLVSKISIGMIQMYSFYSLNLQSNFGYGERV